MLNKCSGNENVDDLMYQFELNLLLPFHRRRLLNWKGTTVLLSWALATNSSDFPSEQTKHFHNFPRMFPWENAVGSVRDFWLSKERLNTQFQATLLDKKQADEHENVKKKNISHYTLAWLKRVSDFMHHMNLRINYWRSRNVFCFNNLHQISQTFWWNGWIEMECLCSDTRLCTLHLGKKYLKGFLQPDNDQLCALHILIQTLFLGWSFNKVLFLFDDDIENMLFESHAIGEILFCSFNPAHRKVYEKMFISFQVWKHCRFSSRVICIFISPPAQIRYANMVQYLAV